jgi:polysaccharide pyruvyl transferase WcaK-like protein
VTQASPRRTGPGNPRVALVGFQGFGNVGDEAILAGLERLLDGAITVTTVFAGMERPVVAFEGKPRRTTTRFLPTPAALRVLRRSDVLVVSGGGLMNDYWWSVIPRYAAWVAAARLAGCRVVWAAAGVGPIRRRPYRSLAGLAFRASHLVTVRDEASRAWVGRCSTRVVAEVVPDPAFFSVAPPPAGAVARRRNSGTTGIIVRAPAPGGPESAANRLADGVAGVAARSAARGQAVELLTMHDHVDEPFVRHVLDRCRDLGTEPGVAALPLEPDAAVALLARYERLATVRLHGLILAALAGTPAVAIGYDAKVSAAATELGLADLCLPLEGLTADALEAALDRSLDPALRKTLGERVAAIRARGDEVRRLLREAFA